MAHSAANQRIAADRVQLRPRLWHQQANVPGIAFTDEAGGHAPAGD